VTTYLMLVYRNAVRAKVPRTVLKKNYRDSLSVVAAFIVCKNPV